MISFFFFIFQLQNNKKLTHNNPPGPSGALITTGRLFIIMAQLICAPDLFVLVTLDFWNYFRQPKKILNIYLLTNQCIYIRGSVWVSVSEQFRDPSLAECQALQGGRGWKHQPQPNNHAISRHITNSRARKLQFCINQDKCHI